MATYPNQKTEDAEKTGDINLASVNFGVPKDVRDARKRQYTNKNYTIDDKKLIINFEKNNTKGKV